MALAGRPYRLRPARLERAHSGAVEHVGRWVVPWRLELAVTYCAVTLDFEVSSRMRRWVVSEFRVDAGGAAADLNGLRSIHRKPIVAGMISEYRHAA
ncbi:hypothetical protein ACIBQ1_54650 [Nonomuraea sp. NPDC050153]|uniref:hypothetical protein n=1 Tax=Nonomuraea sp. NPDC050153 TaxID=3364359 RepID=UPI00378BAB08